MINVTKMMLSVGMSAALDMGSGMAASAVPVSARAGPLRGHTGEDYRLSMESVCGPTHENE
jgi:hypothetical protein